MVKISMIVFKFSNTIPNKFNPGLIAKTNERNAKGVTAPIHLGDIMFTFNYLFLSLS